MKKLSPVTISLITIVGSIILKQLKKSGWLDANKITDAIIDNAIGYLRRA